MEPRPAGRLPRPETRHAVLVVDHGSRRREASREAEELVRRLGERLPGVRVALAHLETARPGIEEAVGELYEEGVRELRVQPLFLARGAHVERDLPQALRRAAERCPGLRFRIAEPLGGHPLLEEIVLDRLAEVGSG